MIPRHPWVYYQKYVVMSLNMNKDYQTSFQKKWSISLQKLFRCSPHVTLQTPLFFVFICLHSASRNYKLLKIKLPTLWRAARVDFLICGMIVVLPQKSQCLNPCHVCFWVAQDTNFWTDQNFLKFIIKVIIEMNTKTTVPGFALLLIFTSTIVQDALGFYINPPFKP